MKEIKFNDDARKRIIKGVKVTADAVSSTLGPRGTNVIFEETSYPTITKDGVTVARQVELEDKFENMGVMMAREASENTNAEAGDGTSSTIVLLEAMVQEANKYIVAGMNPILIKRGMDNALKNILTSLAKQVKEVKTTKERLNVATISANNDPVVGQLIVDILKKVGVDGIVLAKGSMLLETEVEYINGTKIGGGYLSPMFVNNQRKLTAEVKNPRIIICSEELHSQAQLTPLITRLLTDGHTDIILLAKKISGSALGFIAQNYMKGQFRCVPVEMSSMGVSQKDFMHDLAALTESTVIGQDEAFQLEDAGTEQTGTCEIAVVGKSETVLSGSKGNISKRLAEIATLLKDEKDLHKKNKLNERKGRLTGSIATINIGGSSETEQTELQYRIEDALCATRHAIREGIVEGGGVALLKCMQEKDTKVNDYSKEFLAGIDIVYNALMRPLQKIVENSGGSGDAVVAKVLETGKGYNALTETYGDLLKMGIIDPYKVSQQVLINSVATAGILITSSVAITIKQKK